MIDAGELLGSDLLTTYLDSMEEASDCMTDYDKQVRKWCAATGDGQGDSDEDEDDNS